MGKCSCRHKKLSVQFQRIRHCIMPPWNHGQKQAMPIQGTAPYMGKGAKLQAMHQGKSWLFHRQLSARFPLLVGDTTSLPSPSHQLHQHHHHYFFSACGTTTREGDIPCHRPHVPARLSWATSRIALSASRRSTPVRAGRTSTGNQGSIGHRRFAPFDVVPF